MEYQVNLTAPASQDARDYYSYLKHENLSPEAANRWYNELFDSLQSLKFFPTKFSLIPEAEELQLPLRSFVFYSHRVIFAIQEESKTVIVYRIFHSARKPLTLGELD